MGEVGVGLQKGWDSDGRGGMDGMVVGVGAG